MSGKIFINYRRELSQGEALHLSTILTRRFGRNRIFIDTHGIDGFSDWLNVLKQQVAGSAAMIAVIGPGWLEVTDDKGNRRLDNPEDFVRFEIAEALSRDIPVLPVLLDGAELPEREQLPENMRGMLRRQAMDLHARRFEANARDISRELRKILRRRRVVPIWAAAGLALASLGGGVLAGPDILRQADRLIPGVDLAPRTGPAELQQEVEKLEKALAEAEETERSARADLKEAQIQISTLKDELDRLKLEPDVAHKNSGVPESRVACRIDNSNGVINQIETMFPLTGKAPPYSEVLRFIKSNVPDMKQNCRTYFQTQILQSDKIACKAKIMAYVFSQDPSLANSQHLAIAKEIFRENSNKICFQQ